MRIFFLGGTLAASLIGHRVVRESPCYVVLTAVVVDPEPYHIRRVVTSGARRVEESGSGPTDRERCIEPNRQLMDEAKASILVHLAGGDNARKVEWVETSGRSVADATKHLSFIVRRAVADDATFPGVEVIRPDASTESPLPRLFEADSTHAQCEARNNAMKKPRDPRAIAFRWAC